MSLARILIAEDNLDIYQLLQFAYPSYEMTSATDGEEAITKLTADKFDALLLDLTLPVTSGWEVLRIVQDTDNGWPEMPVVVISAQCEPEHVLKAWSLGAKFYVTKPFGIAQLGRVLERTLETPMTEYHVG